MNAVLYLMYVKVALVQTRKEAMYALAPRDLDCLTMEKNA